MNDIKLFFDELAPTWDKKVEKKNEKLIEEILNIIPIKKGNKVLDIGCGTGAITSLLQKKSQNTVIGLDISKKMIDLAKQKNTNPSIIFINQDYYSYEDNNIDVIVCFDSYPHFVEIDKFISKSYSLLKDEGILAIIFDISHKEINECHNNHHSYISRQIEHVDKEAKLFDNHFKLIKKVDDDSKYIMIFKKVSK